MNPRISGQIDVAAIYSQEINSGPEKSVEFHPLSVILTTASLLLIGQQTNQPENNFFR